jgi:uncharacterized protein with HEPN domain
MRIGQAMSGYLAVERIQDYTEDLDEVTFLKEEMAQDAVIRNLEVIGGGLVSGHETQPEAHFRTPAASS